MPDTGHLIAFAPVVITVGWVAVFLARKPQWARPWPGLPSNC